MKNFDSYYDPPDDDPICEDDCGEYKERDIEGKWVCVNKFCPLNFPEKSVEREMAEHLLDDKDEIESLERKVRDLIYRLEKQGAEHGS